MAFSPAPSEWEPRGFQYWLLQHSSSHDFCPSVSHPFPLQVAAPCKTHRLCRGASQPDLKNKKCCFCAEEHGELEFLQPGPLQSLATPLEAAGSSPAHTFLSLALTPGVTSPARWTEGWNRFAPNLFSQPFGSRAFPLSEVSSPRWAHTACQHGSEPRESLTPWKTAGPQSTRDTTPPDITYRRWDVVPLVLLPAENRELGFPDHSCSTSDEQLSCALRSWDTSVPAQTASSTSQDNSSCREGLPVSTLCVCIIIYNCVW